jgi:hypothetical protein
MTRLFSLFSTLFPLILAIVLLSVITTRAEARNTPQIVGQINIKTTSLNLDRQARKELEQILNKLKKLPGNNTIKIQGNYGAAKSQDEYFTNSLFMSKEVEEYLHDALDSKHEILVAAGDFKQQKSAQAQNTVTIFLLPLKFLVQKIDHERLPAHLHEDRPLQENEVAVVSEAEQTVKPLPKEKSPEELAAEKMAEELRLTEERQLVEDTSKADELVAKEKLRAAEREKKLRAEEERRNRLSAQNEM